MAQSDQSGWEGEAPAEPRVGRDGLPRRKRPASGVFLNPLTTTIVYVTASTRGRRRWLPTPEVHELLRSVWQDASAWLVGQYVIMPDHIHLFAGPGDDAVGTARRDGGSAGASPSHGGST